jgi:hypothetical protein
MHLTSSQSELLDGVVEHIRDGDRSKPLLIEGVSGVGKSTIVEEAVRQLGLQSVELDGPHRRNAFEGMELENTVAIAEIRTAGLVPAFRDLIKDKARQLILLSHPRFLEDDSSGSELVDQSVELLDEGIEVVHCRLPVMSQSEVQAYLENKDRSDAIDMVEELGLGIAGHINRLLAMSDLGEERLRLLTHAKIFQILHCAERFHDGPVERIGTVLGRQLSDALKGSFLRDNRRFNFNHGLEDRLSSLEDVEFPFPRFDETLNYYREMLRRNDCSAVEIFVPECPQPILDELGLEEGDFCRNGRVLQFCSGPMKVGFATQAIQGGDWQVANQSKRRLGERGVGTLQPNMHALQFSAHRHGGYTMIDSPMAPYAVETLLQGKGILYEVKYNQKEGGLVCFKVDNEGVSELKVEKKYS